MKKTIKWVGCKLLWIITFMIGIVLSIVNANGWLVVPTTCRVFCWIFSILSYLIYAYIKGVFESKSVREIIEKNNNGSSK